MFVIFWVRIVWDVWGVVCVGGYLGRLGFCGCCWRWWVWEFGMELGWLGVFRCIGVCWLLSVFSVFGFCCFFFSVVFLGELVDGLCVFLVFMRNIGVVFIFLFWKFGLVCGCVLLVGEGMRVFVDFVCWEVVFFWFL